MCKEEAMPILFGSSPGGTEENKEIPQSGLLVSVDSQTEHLQNTSERGYR
jgi:hypothetical protein